MVCLLVLDHFKLVAKLYLVIIEGRCIPDLPCQMLIDKFPHLLLVGLSLIIRSLWSLWSP